MSENLSYTINFLWFNKQLDKNQQYLFPTKPDEKDQVDKQRVGILNNAYKWALNNYPQKVIIWYDPNTTIEKAIENTHEIINGDDKYMQILINKQINELTKQLNKLKIKKLKSLKNDELKNKKSEQDAKMNSIINELWEKIGEPSNILKMLY